MEPMEKRPELPPDDEPADSIESLLERASRGDERAAMRLFDALYSDLHRCAEHAMRGQRPGTLQPTAIVNEAYIRLVKGSHDWETRDHFMYTAARVMRHVLIDYHRKKRAAKRSGGERVVCELDELAREFDDKALDLEALNTALEKLAEMDEVMSRAVELRFFGGASIQETARILDLGLRTFERRWKATRAWLLAEIR